MADRTLDALKHLETSLKKPDERRSKELLDNGRRDAKKARRSGKSIYPMDELSFNEESNIYAMGWNSVAFAPESGD